MSFYKLVHLLYPEYIPPDKFVFPMKNKFSLFVQFALQKKSKMYIYKLITYEEDKQMYHRVFVIHRRLSKFVTRVKFLYSKQFNDTNLYGDPLKKRHITLIENNKLYKFDYFEMFKLIKEKIYYHDHYFLLPMMPTNPYTNIPFSLHNLYNIYLQMLSSLYIIPYGIRIFFSVGFDLNKLIDKFSYNIQVDLINDGFKKLSKHRKYEYMRDMMVYYKKKVFLNVQEDKLYEIFHKQVLEYYKSLYTPDWCARLIVYQLRTHLDAYHRKHPHFGKLNYNIFSNELTGRF